MPLDLALSGQAWRWQLKDDQPVEEWLQVRPWLGRGGVLVIQAPQRHAGMVDALRKAVFAADARASEVRVAELEIAAGRKASSALATWLGINVRQERELLLKLAEDLEVRPAIFLCDARDVASAGHWAEEFAALVDLARKLDVSAPTVMLLIGRAAAPLRGRYELDRGWPIGLTRALIDWPRDKVWAPYVHLRIAWECGGVVDDALACAASAEATIENDDGMETMLNKFALAKFDAISAEERTAWVAHVGSGHVRGPTPTVHGRAEETDGRLTPFPWLARALLLRRGHTGGASRALRTEINCRPLSEQVLNACFAVEGSLRGRLPTKLGVAPEDLQFSYDRFAANGRLGPCIETALYPGPHPARPSDPWDFASVGVVMQHVQNIAQAERTLVGRVRILRNAVAHCHYVGWHGLLEAREIRGLVG